MQRTIQKGAAAESNGRGWQLPAELRRTKPYGYSLFNLDAMTTICQLLSSPEDDLWSFELADGRGIRRSVSYMVPFIRNRKTWPLKPDVMYDAEWPMRQPSLLFAGIAFGNRDYIALWKTLEGRFRRRRSNPQLLHKTTRSLGLSSNFRAEFGVRRLGAAFSPPERITRGTTKAAPSRRTAM